MIGEMSVIHDDLELHWSPAVLNEAEGLIRLS